MIEPGRVCVKVAGKEAGKKCVIVGIIDQNHVLVSGPEVKRKRCNIIHLEPLEEKVDIKEGASDEEINQLIKSA